MQSIKAFLSEFSPVFREDGVVALDDDALSRIREGDGHIKLTAKQLEAARLLVKHKYVLLYGGARSGKTVIIMLYLLTECLLNPGLQVLVVRQNFVDVKNTLLEDTFSKFLANKYDFQHEVKGNSPIKLDFMNGSGISFWGVQGGNKTTGLDKHLGSEYAKIYINEASQVDYRSFQLFRSRLNSRAIGIDGTKIKTQIILDCNPPSQSHWLYKYFIKNIDPVTGFSMDDLVSAHVVSLQMNPVDNLENLSEGEQYLKDLENLGGKEALRLYRGEFHAEGQGSFFEYNFIKIEDLDIKDLKFECIVIGVDPALTSHDESDETGIVAVGAVRGDDGKNIYYVLADRSARYAPTHWIAAVVELGWRFRALGCIELYISLETNAGGAFLIHMLESELDRGDANSLFQIKHFRSIKSKSARLTPVASLYKNDRVVHLDSFPELVEEMVSFTGLPQDKDDRLDALGHAFMLLFEIYGADIRQPDFKSVNKAYESLVVSYGGTVLSRDYEY